MLGDLKNDISWMDVDGCSLPHLHTHTDLWPLTWVTNIVHVWILYIYTCMIHFSWFVTCDC